MPARSRMHVASPARPVAPASRNVATPRRKEGPARGAAGQRNGCGDASDREEEEEEEVAAFLDSDELDDPPEGHTSAQKRKRASPVRPNVAPKRKAAARGRRKSADNTAYKYSAELDSADDDGAPLDSDALDEDGDAARKKRKRVSPAKKAPAKKASPGKGGRRGETDGEDEDDGVELKEGQEVVGVVVQAPKAGRVPPGQVSQNTFSFLSQLKKPECNDREWFKLHEPVYRLAEKEWKDFVDGLTPLLVDVDPQVPHLPPKDVIHRIYRDVRFSNDKTPYKTGFSASFSRSGRKGIFAGFKPGGESLVAAGSWCPGKNELATIRSNILRSPKRLRQTISAPEFVRYFGAPQPGPAGERSSIFGRDDELKNAPKGVAKDHPDIDLLKCRSFAVIHRFMDSEVLAPDFKKSLCKVLTVMQPLVHCLNDMMTIQDHDSSDEGDEDEGDEDGE